jgi:membrane-bound lytic murein transglycosylase B
MRNLAMAMLFFISLGAANARGATSDNSGQVGVAGGAGLTADEQQRMQQLRDRLCQRKELNCENITALFADPRLTIYEPPEPAPEETPARTKKSPQRNPYLTTRFGLLTPESLERCRTFIAAHAVTFDAAHERYGVPKEVICGHLRIETNFGLPTRLSPNPLGSRPAINQLVSLYVRKPSARNRPSRFLHRQQFALAELTDLLSSSEKFGWDLFEVPGSPTGAIGLVQFEPSNFGVAVDSNGDGKVDLFDGDDAILSVAHYLATRGYDRNPDHQKRAIYAYYGGHYDHDPNKFYMRAVLQYASAFNVYLKDHPVESEAVQAPNPASSDKPEIKPPDAALVTQ